jgi:hypothetical protein
LRVRPEEYDREGPSEAVPQSRVLNHGVRHLKCARL